MKRKFITYLALTVGLVLTGISCSDSFFEQGPPGAYSSSSLSNSKGVEGMLIATYSMLDGLYFEDWGNNYFVQNGGASNWVWGSIRGGDAYKGTEPSDFVDLNSVETHSVQISNGVLGNKWTACYDGIGRANETLRNLAAATDISAENAKRIEGEARFLRAHFHFEALKVFGAVPYVDETVASPSAYFAVTNDHMIWDEIKADFQFAFDNLPGTQINPGRANKWAAGAFLAKVLVYQARWAEAKTIIDNVITNGTTSKGQGYQLEPRYGDIFRVATEANSRESIFAYEASFGSGTIANGNYENTLNQPHGGTSKTSCCGFFQPSQNLVNSYKVDANGLPMPASYNNSDLPNDEGLLSSQAYNPDWTIPVDPRLDHSVGRRGVPFMDWGPHPGNDWIRLVTNGGPYSPKKNVPAVSELGSVAGVIDWGFAATAQNVHIMRFADLLLLSAEVEAELGNVSAALSRVNAVRARAQNPAGFVSGSPANYQIGQYPSFASADAALEAVRFERKLELAMEGHRMFDIVRWDLAAKAGKSRNTTFRAASYLNNEYLSKEKVKRNHLSAASFTDKYLFVPIPEYVVTQMTVGGTKMIDQTTEWGGTRTVSLD